MPKAISDPVKVRKPSSTSKEMTPIRKWSIAPVASPPASIASRYSHVPMRPDGQAAEAVRERGPLRHRGHGHQQRERQADDGAHDHADDDPLEALDLRLDQRADDGQHHADLAGDDALPRGGRGAEPLQRHDEEARRHQVAHLRQRRHGQRRGAGHRHREIAQRQHDRGDRGGGLAPLEHLQHPVRDEEPGHHVGHRGGDGDGRQGHDEQVLVRPGLLAEHQQCADEADRRNRVGQRHQRRVQQRRHAADDVEPEEGGQQEDEDVGEDVHGGWLRTAGPTPLLPADP